jgi:ABC-type uncharacterized transport system permease subunit
LVAFVVGCRAEKTLSILSWYCFAGKYWSWIHDPWRQGRPIVVCLFSKGAITSTW